LPDVAVLSCSPRAGQEVDAKYDDAASLYTQIATSTALLFHPKPQLATYWSMKTGQHKEAADILFQLVENARKAKDGRSPCAFAARSAAQQLQS
jgi:hypothetical protein